MPWASLKMIGSPDNLQGATITLLLDKIKPEQHGEHKFVIKVRDEFGDQTRQETTVVVRYNIRWVYD
jgi:hypothetical protein